MTDESDYELYDQNKECAPLLPINPVTNSITLYKVSIFSKPVTFSERPLIFVGDRKKEVESFTLGLPNHYINSFYLYAEGTTQLQVGEKVALIVSSNRTFLPAKADKVDEVHFFRKLEEIAVDKPDIIQGSKITIHGKNIQLTEENVQEFERFGETNARLANSNRLVRLILQTEIIEVPKYATFLKNQKVNHHGKEQAINISEDNLKLLGVRGQALGQIETKSVRLHLSQPPRNIILPNTTTLSAQAITVSTAIDQLEFDTSNRLLLDSVPHPNPLSDDDYCLILEFLLADDRFEAGFDYLDPPLQTSNPPNSQYDDEKKLFRTLFHFYRINYRYEKCMIKNQGIESLYDPTGQINWKRVPRQPKILGKELFCKIVQILLTNADFQQASIQFASTGEFSLPSGFTYFEFEIFRTYFNDDRFTVCANTNQLPGSDENESGQDDYTVSKPEAPRYEIGLVTTYQQDWELKGYSRGALLSSITLAPREETKIELFTWDRYKLEEEKSFGSEYESNREINTLGRASANIAHELNKTMDAKANANGGLSLPTEYVDVKVGADGGISSHIDDNLENTVEQINEITKQTSERYKATHQVKIVQTHETGEETRTTRTLFNPNAARTLSLHHFEILENYKVTTKIKQANTYCLLVKNPQLAEFDIDNVRAYEDVLQRVLLSSNYRDGFKAAQILAGQRWFANQPSPPSSAPLANNGLPANQSNTTPTGGIFETAKSLKEIVDTFLNLDLISSFKTIYNHNNPINMTNVSGSKLKSAENNIRMLSFWEKMKAIYPGFEKKAEAFKKNYQSNTAEAEIIRQVGLLVEGLDDDWVHNVKMIAASSITYVIVQMAFNILATPLAVTPFSIFYYPIIFDLVIRHDDKGLQKFLSKAKRQLKTAEAVQEANSLSNTVDISQGEQVDNIIPTIPQAYTFLELAQAQAQFEKLKLHLEANRTYYVNEIWRAEDSNARLERLKGIGIAPFVENRLLGFTGKKAMYPLRFATLPETVKQTLEDDFSGIDSRDDKRKKPKKIKSENISLPTSGVHMEATLGQCDAIEPYLQERREIDLQLRRAAAWEAKQRSRQQQLEAERLEQRLQHDPQLLDPPFNQQPTNNTTLPGEDVIDDLI